MEGYVIARADTKREAWTVTRLSARWNPSINKQEITGYTYQRLFATRLRAKRFAGKQANRRKQQNPKLPRATFYTDTEAPSNYKEEGN